MTLIARLGESRLTTKLLVVAAILVLAILTFVSVVRPWYLKWGATDAELAMTLPGDELIPQASGMITRALTIKAPAEKVWPWLVQVGYKRAGWYNLDWVNGLFGAADFVDGHRSSTRIVPELQDLKVGDFVRIHPQGGFYVAKLQPYRALVLMTKMDGASGALIKPDEPLPSRYVANSLAIVLQPLDDNTTRMIFRDSTGSSGKVSGFWALLEPGIFIQESRFMLGVKRRAEALAGLN